MIQSVMEYVESRQLKKDLPDVQVGDTVDVHCRIVEGDKERIQIFTGVVIAVAGRGISRSLTVRRIVANEGVERVIPLHSPRIAKIEVTRQGHVRRGKLYFLRDRVGKSRRLSDRRRGIKRAVPGEETPAAPAAEKAQA